MHSNNNNEIIKRSILLGARIRFSPSGATVREKAITRIVEQNLACKAIDQNVTAEDLCHSICFADHLTLLRDADVREGLQILEANGRVVKTVVNDREVFSLSEIAQEENSHFQSECRRRDNQILQQLFKIAKGGYQAYEKAFYYLLGSVFSILTESYVQSITLEGKKSALAEHQLLDNAIQQTITRYNLPDKTAFIYGVKQFFRESTPEFDQLKWNMAQNYYVTRALGCDKSAELLSVDLLKGSSLYCDTNILIAALVHKSFQELLRSCESMGTRLCAAFISIRELRGVVEAHSNMLRKVVSLIPDATKSKVTGFLYESYLSELDLDPKVSDAFLSRFDLGIKTIEDELNIQVHDDKIFDAIAKEGKTATLAQDLIAKYKSPRKRPKFKGAAEHDAQLIIFVRKENEANRKSWIVTLDTSLAAWRADQDNEKCRLITLDALLQWLAPVVVDAVDENRLAEIFSESLRYQILPRDVFFDMRDFQIFADMGIETAQLPAEDVEACIREVQQKCATLDPSQPADREKIGQIVQRFFADPGNKYKKRLSDLQRENETIKSSLQEEKEQREKAEAAIKSLEKQNNDLASQISDAEKAKDAADKRLSEIENQMEGTDKRTNIILIIIITVICFVVLLILLSFTCFLAWKYAEGQNLFQRITNFWLWHTLAFAVVCIVYPFVMGRKRMRMLKWWKGESD